MGKAETIMKITLKEYQISYTPFVVFYSKIVWNDDWSWWGDTEHYIKLYWRD